MSDLTPAAAVRPPIDDGPRSSRLGDFMGRYAISVVFLGLLIVLLIASPDFRIAKVGINPFVATLGMQVFVRPTNGASWVGGYATMGPSGSEPVAMGMSAPTQSLNEPG